jgi:predicted flap endonuclease-1-like 5' DNA nuclease
MRPAFPGRLEIEDGGVSVIVISMVLVVVGFVTLMLGVLGVGDDPLQFVYVSIAACLVAAVFLVIGVVRGRPSKKPVASSGDGGDASWSGASAWGDKDGDKSASKGAMDRDEPEAASTPRVQVVTAQDATGDGDEGFQPAPEQEDEDEPVVVPKRTAADRASAGADAAGVEVQSAEDALAGASPAGATKRTSKKSTAKKSTAKKSTAKKSTAKKSTAKKATAKKATAKKATAKKASARKASAGRDDAARVEEKLGDVSGVGPAKRKALLEHFGSFDALAGATPTDLQKVDGVSETLANRIRRAMR